MSDPFEVIRRANPVADPGRIPQAAGPGSAEALMEEIMSMENTRSRTRKPRRRVMLMVAAAAVVSATAAGVVALREEGNLDSPPFSGDDWQLIVGEGANGDSGTFKVCHRFAPAEGVSDGNGFGPSGCVTWPPETPTDSIVIDVVPVETADGMLLFVDLSADPFDVISTTTDGGTTVDVEPFRMPQSGKQFAVVELPARTRSATLRLMSSDGTVIESRTVSDIMGAP